MVYVPQYDPVAVYAPAPAPATAVAPATDRAASDRGKQSPQSTPGKPAAAPAKAKGVKDKTPG